MSDAGLGYSNRCSRLCPPFPHTHTHPPTTSSPRWNPDNWSYGMGADMALAKPLGVSPNGAKPRSLRHLPLLCLPFSTFPHKIIITSNLWHTILVSACSVSAWNRERANRPLIAPRRLVPQTASSVIYKWLQANAVSLIYIGVIVRTRFSNVVCSPRYSPLLV